MPRGGPRKGSGRKPGSPNARSAIEAIRAVADRHPDWHPLIQMADVANDTDLPIETRLDACKSAARWMIPPPKPVELEPDALVELEARLVRVKLEAQDQLLHSKPGLADRLARAKQQVFVVTGITRAPDEPILEPIVGLSERLSNARATAERLAPPEDAPAPSERPVPAPARPVADTEPSGPPEPYRPLMPTPAPASFSTLMSEDYNPFSTKD